MHLKHRVPYVCRLYSRKRRGEQANASHVPKYYTAYLLRDGAAQLQECAVTRDGQVLHWRYLSKSMTGFEERNTESMTVRTRWPTSRERSTASDIFNGRRPFTAPSIPDRLESSPMIDDRVRARPRRRLTCTRYRAPDTWYDATE